MAILAVIKPFEQPMATVTPQIEASWLNALQEEFEQPHFEEIKQYLVNEKQQGHVVYPPGQLIFNAFNLTPFDKVKVVILGQDPYHGQGQAHGLCFSVPDDIKPPPSLVNIFKELNSDIGMPIPKGGNLIGWAKQGVLLINSILTVAANQPASHSKIGWERFTDAVIMKLSKERKGIVFLLWGRFAQDKAQLIDPSRNHVLKAAHPSPFSAYNGFMGCKHFSKTNTLLVNQGLPPIEWSAI